MTLLIVDDEIFAVQGILKDIDKSRAAFDEILTANSYAQALNYFIMKKIDVLLCDIEMPYGTGLDLVEWVKGQSPETECIFLTCHDEFSFAKQAITLQCLDYILKPAPAEVINQVLLKAVKRISEKQDEKVYKEYGKIYMDSISEVNKEEQPDTRHAVERVEEYIRSHIEENFSVEDLAAQVYLSSAHLSRLFKKKHGLTLIDYITSERMKLAKYLLENTELTVTMISAKTGYSNYSYFTKQFKKSYGKTPREFRQQKI